MTMMVLRYIYVYIRMPDVDDMAKDVWCRETKWQCRWIGDWQKKNGGGKEDANPFCRTARAVAWM